MAKQAGILKINGSLDGLNFYMLNGKHIVRKAGGGFTRKAIKTKASMRSVRESNNEFGHCSKVNKAFRTALFAFHTGHQVLPFHHKLMPFFYKLKDLDEVHTRGQRTVGTGIMTEAGRSLLFDFNYTPHCDPKEKLPFEMRYDSQEHRLNITDLDPTDVSFPKGASRLQLQFGVLDFNFETLKHALYLSESRVYDAGSSITSPELRVNITEAIQGTLLPVLGIRFYMGANERFLALKGVEGSGFCLMDSRY